MRTLDAIYIVLKESADPLDAPTITKLILEKGLWETEGKTPERMISSVLSVDLQKNGINSRFRKAGWGLFTVNRDVENVIFTDSDDKAGSENGSAIPIPANIEPVSTPVEQTPIVPIAEVLVIKTDTTTAKPAKSTEKVLSFADAAERILQKYADRQPMHYRKITSKAIELGIIETSAQTPTAVMYSVIIGDIQRRVKRGELPRFTQHGKGLLGLTEWEERSETEKSLATLIEEHNRQIRQQLHEQLYQMHPTDFETLVGRLLTAIGFESVSVTKASGDGGIDVIGVLVVGDVVRIKMAVQVKRWRQNVQTPIIQQVRGSVSNHERGLVITTSDFSKGARVDAARTDATPVDIMNGTQLVKLLIENGIGIRRTKHDLIELGEKDEEDEE